MFFRKTFMSRITLNVSTFLRYEWFLLPTGGDVQRTGITTLFPV